MFEKINVSQLIRYGYGGFLLTGIVAFFAPAQIKGAIEAGGTVVAPLVILAIGVAVYVLQRHVVGELVIYPFTHLVHFLSDKLLRQGGVSCPTGYLATRGVPLGLRRAAYTDIRREFFSEDERNRLDLAHSEAHVLWLTAVEFSCAFLYVCFLATKPSTAVFWFFLVTATAVTASATVLDIRLHRNEHRLLRARSAEEVDGFLRQKGYIE